MGRASLWGMRNAVLVISAISQAPCNLAAPDVGYAESLREPSSGQPVVQRSATPRNVVQVKAPDGTLVPGHYREFECVFLACSERVTDTWTGRVVFEGGRWAKGYLRTGNGLEVVRVKGVISE